MTKIAHGLALTLATLCLASAAVAKDKKPVDPGKKFCHSDVPTGSRFAVRICHTAAEWASINDANGAAARNSLERATNAGLAGTVSSAGGGR